MLFVRASRNIARFSLTGGSGGSGGGGGGGGVGTATGICVMASLGER